MAGRSINVSEGGMAIGVPRPLDVGAQVVCHILVEGQPASLAGEVTWSTGAAGASSNDEQPDLASAHRSGPQQAHPQQAASARVGIRFEGLSGKQNDLLGRMLSSAVGPGGPIALRFEGMEGHVIARGVVSDDRIRLRAPLPILATHTRVDFRLADGAREFPGEVLGCRIETRGKTPVLEVDVSIGANDGPRTRRQTFYGRASRIELTGHGGTGRSQAADPRGRHDTRPDPEPRGDDTEPSLTRRRSSFDPEQDTTPDPVPPLSEAAVQAMGSRPRQRRLLSGPYALPLRRPGWGAVVAAAVTAALGTWVLLTLQ